MNRIVLLGRLVRDVEQRATNTGREVAVFTLAVDRPFVGQDGKREADFINCQLWGKQAVTLATTTGKGQRVLVEGRLQIRSYEANDGTKKTVAEVVCDRFEYIERKSDSAGQGSTGASKPSSMEGFGVPFDEEIPF